MKHLSNFTFIFLFLTYSLTFAQTESTEQLNQNVSLSRLTTEPAIGINPYPMSDILVSNLIQWNVKERISIVSYTSITFNTAFVRNFNYIQTNYNYSLNQKFGAGVSMNAKRMSHTVSLLAGINHDAFRETLNNPEFEKVVVSVNSLSPDFGLMYNLKTGKKKYFFSYRMYLPLYPYPLITKDISAIDGNLANISLEFGFGIRLK